MKYLDFIKQEMAVIMDRDPAIKSKMEVFLYPSFWALLKYRKAHKLYKKGISTEQESCHKEQQERQE